MSRTARTKSKSSLPAPTPSEAAFERAFASFVDAPGESLPANDVASFVERAFAHAKEYADDRYATIGGASQFHTKLVGVSFEGRQDTIAGLRVGTELALERQPGTNMIPTRLRFATANCNWDSFAKRLPALAPLIDGGRSLPCAGRRKISM